MVRMSRPVSRGFLQTPALRSRACHPPFRLHRWDEIALEKVTEMISRKVVTGEREMLAQIYVKTGALVPMHAHESEQMTYVLQGALKFLVGGEEITVREGEVLHIPSWVPHQAEALEDTFETRSVQSDSPGLARRHRQLLPRRAGAPAEHLVLGARDWRVPQPRCEELHRNSGPVHRSGRAAMRCVTFACPSAPSARASSTPSSSRRRRPRRPPW